MNAASALVKWVEMLVGGYFVHWCPLLSFAVPTCFLLFLVFDYLGSFCFVTPKPKPNMKTNTIPTPHELLAKAKGIVTPQKFSMLDYGPVINELRNKDMSYAQIAAWLSENFGFSVQRGQVYKAFKDWEQIMEEIRQEEEENARNAAYEEEQEPEMPDDEGAEPPDDDEGKPITFGSLEEAKAFAENLDENMAAIEDRKLERSKKKA